MSFTSGCCSWSVCFVHAHVLGNMSKSMYVEVQGVVTGQVGLGGIACLFEKFSGTLSVHPCLFSCPNPVSRAQISQEGGQWETPSHPSSWDLGAHWLTYGGTLPSWWGLGDSTHPWTLLDL